MRNGSLKAKKALVVERPIIQKAEVCADHFIRIHAASKPRIGCLCSYHVLESRIPPDALSMDDILAQPAHWKRSVTDFIGNGL